METANDPGAEGFAIPIAGGVAKSQQNAQRQGFDLLYTRAVLVKHPLEGDEHE